MALIQLGYKIITNWKPILSEDISQLTWIGGEFEKVLREHELVPMRWMDIRAPSYNQSIYRNQSDGVTEWHHDKGQQTYLVLWSNIGCTEILLGNGQIISPEDGSIVLLDNDKVVHRVKGEYPNRWFIKTCPLFPEKMNALLEQNDIYFRY